VPEVDDEEAKYPAPAPTARPTMSKTAATAEEMAL
jgi:hypothetical protein